MKLDSKRLAVAVAAAALSLPALAAEPAFTSAVREDPTFPALARPAPAVSLSGPARTAAPDLTAADYAGVATALVAQGPATAVALDTSRPDYVGAAPAVAVSGAAQGTAAHVAER